MNAAIDAGNTFIKVGIYRDNQLSEILSFPSDRFQNIYTHLGLMHFEQCIISGVVPIPEHIIRYLAIKSGKLIVLDENTKLPVSIKYKSPTTLGKDRIALAVAASERFPGKDVLCISIGTCITYNFVGAKKVFQGGAISPGLHMRLRSMHEFTAGLPLINLDEADSDLVGNSTANSMASGIINGIKFEIEGFISELQKKHKNCAVIISGGDSRYFADKLDTKVEIEPNLALEGLDIILKFNAPEKK